MIDLHTLVHVVYNYTYIIIYTVYNHTYYIITHCTCILVHIHNYTYSYTCMLHMSMKHNTHYKWIHFVDNRNAQQELLSEELNWQTKRSLSELLVLPSNPIKEFRL